MFGKPAQDLNDVGDDGDAADWRLAMITLTCRAALALLFVVSVACDDAVRLTGPSPLSPSAPPPPVTTTPLPLPNGASTTYIFREPLENFGAYRVRHYTERSSFVLYDTGDFYLQVEDIPGRAGGRYVQENGQIRFYFSERSQTADAIGTLREDLLEVRYTDLMLHSDYENAVYQRVE
jgi:hypothetical protein